jgi:hypothetical protein
MTNEVANYDAAWAKMAEQWAQEERLQGGTFLSTRGGILKFGDEELPNGVPVIVLASVRENTYYTEKYDEDHKQAPICYAFGSGPNAEEEMAPHESMQVDLSYFEPQGETCKLCPHNVWGSAEKGKGKACQNRRRLAVIPAGYYEARRGSRDFDLNLFEDPKDFQTAEIAYLKLPVMSVKPWAEYVAQVGMQTHRPPQGVITRLHLEPHPKAQYQVQFELVEPLKNELVPAIMSRIEEATKRIVQGYRPPEEQGTQPGTRGLTGQRRAG